VLQTSNCLEKIQFLMTASPLQRIATLLVSAVVSPRFFWTDIHALGQFVR